MRRVLLAIAFLFATQAVIAGQEIHALPARGTIEVAFSPNGGATALVVKTIADAKKSILVQAYSFTSAPIARALAQAKERGVDVRVILDKSQKSEHYTVATYLSNHNIPTWIDQQHAIAHNKVMVIDGDTVITGNFNFTKAAEEKNAENVIVLRGNPELADVFAANWIKHQAHSERY
jgi:phosphatidylserine/phosphatidylglycerophosphate/cardiolipin synthase-like enzyme